MTFIGMIDRDQAQGRLNEVYEEIVAWRNGRLPPPFKGISLNAEAVAAVKQLNSAVTFGASTLGARREEMLGTFISTINDCDY